MWKIVKPEQVVNIWTCDDCLICIEINPDWYQDNGTPTCPCCDGDMEYKMTRVDIEIADELC